MEPIRAVRSGDVLELVLDTPGSSVNVFGPPAAAQLDAVLRSLPQGVEMLVLRSGKRGSFVNGAGLLYANAMRTAEDAIATSAPVRAVYERLAACPVRTVAVIEGNAFGCGLELAAACDVRLARDLPETQLRMTELTDYRFVPLFGGTWRLPRLVGAEAAAALLLDGERWSAREALTRGLVDAVIEGEEVGAAARAARRRPRAEASGPPRSRIVPPSRAALWAEVAELLARGTVEPVETCRAREVEAFARTVTSPAAKRAMGFFFVRYAARAASLGSADRTAPPVEMDVHPGVDVLHPLGEEARLCEISAAPGDRDAARAVASALAWQGFEVVVSLGSGAHVAAELVRTTRAFLRESGLDETSELRSLEAAFWELGAADPLRVLGGARRDDDRTTTRADGTARMRVRALASAWQTTIDRAVERGVLRHVSQGDVLVHALFDMPVELGGFSRWLADERGRST